MKNFLYIVLLFVGPAAFAQKTALSTNAASWADGLTLNVDAHYAMARHWTVNAGVRYNPYSPASKQRAVSLGARYWPWYSYSGWWMGASAKCQEYSRTLSKTAEGDRYGGTFALGYSRMLGVHVNLDVGMGVFGGYENFALYRCPDCGRLLESGARYFILPDELIFALTYVF